MSASERMTVWDVARYLGVSRQRFEAISRNAAYRFPPPVEDTHSTARVWDRTAVEAWANERWWGRQGWRLRRGFPGR